MSIEELRVLTEIRDVLSLINSKIPPNIRELIDEVDDFEEPNLDDDQPEAKYPRLTRSEPMSENPYWNTFPFNNPENPFMN